MVPYDCGGQYGPYLLSMLMLNSVTSLNAILTN